MKTQPMASALRLTLSPSEADDWMDLAERAERAGVVLPMRIADMIAQLSICSADVRRKQATKRAERDYVKRLERDRQERERYFMIGDHYSVIAGRADYADVTPDPDHRVWVDVAFQGFLNKPIPDQCEIRRDVWLVRVVRLRGAAQSSIVGSDCTYGNGDAEIREVADRLIASWEATHPAFEVAA